MPFKAAVLCPPVFPVPMQYNAGLANCPAIIREIKMESKNYIIRIAFLFYPGGSLILCI